jgi:hypothetical protein
LNIYLAAYLGEEEWVTIHHYRKERKKERTLRAVVISQKIME